MLFQDQEIHVEIDQTDETQWHTYLDLFHDASIYETYNYGKLHWPGSELSHLVVKSGETVIAAAQVVIKKLPLPGVGIAYIYRGPLWRTSGFPHHPEIFRVALKALVEEYVIRRKLFLRVIPNEPDRGDEGITPVLAGEGFSKHAFLKPYRTFLLDLGPSLEDLRSHLGRSWKSRLKQAKNPELDLSFSQSDDTYQIFVSLYEEMLKNKNFIPGVDVLEFGRVHSELPDRYKFLIALAKYQDRPVATVVCAMAAKQAIYILGASNTEARDLKAAFLLHWDIIQRLKEMGILIYDLGGIDPDKTPGPYHFKSGMGGEDVEFAGTWDRCKNPLLFHLLRMSDRAYIYLKIVKSFIKSRLSKNG